MTKNLSPTAAVVVDPAVSESPRKFLRKAAVIERYGLDERTIDKMSRDGRLPAPHYFGRRLPLWSIAELEECDRRAKAHTLIAPKVYPRRRARAEADTASTTT
jgi:predicted DNA-binding transcriptional regulator AlpA